VFKSFLKKLFRFLQFTLHRQINHLKLMSQKLILKIKMKHPPPITKGSGLMYSI